MDATDGRGVSRETPMKRLVWLAAVAFAFCIVAFGSEPVLTLNGTRWAIDIVPDSSSMNRGERPFSEVLIFANGLATTAGGMRNTGPTPYTEAKSADKKVFFSMERMSAAAGRLNWTGSVQQRHIEGRYVITKPGGAVLSYTFQGDRLD